MQPADAPSRGPAVLAWALLVAGIAAFSARALLQSSLASRGISGFIDDAFYYLVIARNFAASGVATFDGVTPTNGYHPLWMLMEAGLFRALGGGRTLLEQLVAVKALELATLAAALLACAWAFRRLHGRTPLAWGFVGYALVLLAPAWPFFSEGMETTLAAALLAVALLAAIEGQGRLLAATLPLLLLARLDTLVFVIGPIGAWWLARRGRREAWVLVPVAVVAIGFLGATWLATGSPTPISGQIKSSFPFVTAHWSFLRDPIDALPWSGWKALLVGPNLLQVTVAIALAAGAVAAFMRRSPARGAMALALAIAAGLVLNQLLFQRWDKGVDARYLATPWLLVAFSAYAVLGQFRPVIAGACAAAACLGFTVATLQEHRARAGERLDRASHHEVMRMTGPGERFAGTDIGAFSFWLERPFVNLDGLVNDRRLQDAIRDRRFAAYLREMDVRYLALAFWDAPQAHVSRPTDRMYRSRIFPEGVRGPGYDHYDFSVYSYLHDADSDPVRLCPSQEIFRAAIGRDGTANAAIVIYKLALPCGAAGR